MQPSRGSSQFLRSVREAIGVRHFSIRTEETYLDWVKRFILFQGKRDKRTGEGLAAVI